MTTRSEKYQDPSYKWKVMACYLWGIPWAAAGLLLCASIVFSPLGFVCFAVAGWPLARQQKAHLERMRAWSERDRPMPTDSLPPWLLEEPSESTIIDELNDGVEPDA